MSVSTLSKFTVPVAGPNDQTPSSQGLLMPKLKYRFRVVFNQFGIQNDQRLELTKQVMDVTRPSLSFEEIPIDIYNSKLYLAGKHTWEMLTVNIRDDFTNTVSRVIGQQVQRQLDFTEQASAVQGTDYKFQMQIDMLDGGNGAIEENILEQWQLIGCFIQNVNYNDMNYTSNEPATISMTIRYDNAVQTTDGVGGPTTLTRGGTGGQ